MIFVYKVKKNIPKHKIRFCALCYYTALFGVKVTKIGIMWVKIIVHSGIRFFIPGIACCCLMMFFCYDVLLQMAKIGENSIKPILSNRKLYLNENCQDSQLIRKSLRTLLRIHSDTVWGRLQT